MLAERLEVYGIGVVATSEEPKAVETAEITAEHLGVERFVHPGLHEHDRTDAPFLSDEEFDRAAENLFDNPGELVWGNETAEQAGNRFESAVRGVLDEREEDVVAIEPRCG